MFTTTVDHTRSPKFEGKSILDICGGSDIFTLSARGCRSTVKATDTPAMVGDGGTI